MKFQIVCVNIFFFNTTFLHRSDSMIDTVLTLTTESRPQRVPTAPASLNCGKSANFTHFDELDGIAQRFSHPISPEPEVTFNCLQFIAFI